MKLSVMPVEDHELSALDFGSKRTALAIPAVAGHSKAHLTYIRSR